MGISEVYFQKHSQIMTQSQPILQKVSLLDRPNWGIVKAPPACELLTD
jgi:hypothetical protein